MLDLDADTMVEKYGHLQDIDLAFDVIAIREFVRISKTVLIKPKAKTGKYTLDSFAVAGALSAGAHMLPGGLFNGSHGLLHHDAAADAAANTVTPPHVAPEVVQPLPDNVMALHTGYGSISADPGMGMYEAAHRAGFEISQSDLLRAAPDLYRYHLAYPMADGLPVFRYLVLYPRQVSISCVTSQLTIKFLLNNPFAPSVSSAFDATMKPHGAKPIWQKNRNLYL